MFPFGVIELQGGSMNDATRALRYQGAGSSVVYTNKYIDYITMASTETHLTLEI